MISSEPVDSVDSGNPCVDWDSVVCGWETSGADVEEAGNSVPDGADEPES